MKLKIEALRKGKLVIALPGDLIDSVGWEAGDMVEVENRHRSSQGREG
jgi:hypothetical protein